VLGLAVGMIATKQLEQWKALAEAGAEYVVIAPASLAALLSEVERLLAELAAANEMLANWEADPEGVQNY
jgi:2-methylisocitrate lyase-like PEP mutase family enzyme